MQASTAQVADRVDDPDSASDPSDAMRRCLGVARRRADELENHNDVTHR